MTDRDPGEWPVDNPVELDEAEEQGRRHLALVADQARFHMVMDSIRADLQAQPSRACRHAAKRKWVDNIYALVEELDQQQLRNTG
ncbi:hypothetical protein [Streptomyces brevispora]|uniref:Uncharacterized protein n=1 Tax=Streptomyces brevispora TaxID=887462 RepID=A0ABZ1G4W7_9ACTN|nr:hypothetical protein [Streptomyces brevispora]WSC14935.1 hypothetical protein OIE64_20225 [Streptomyces brevispora]